jgi:flagella basal body P-ring formation protein FlgA
LAASSSWRWLRSLSASVWKRMKSSRRSIMSGPIPSMDGADYRQRRQDRSAENPPLCRAIRRFGGWRARVGCDRHVPAVGSPMQRRTGWIIVVGGLRMALARARRAPSPRRIPLALALLLSLAVPAAAATPGSELAERVRTLIDERVMPGGGEVEVTVGEPDSRLRLAPCAHMEPFIPPGARLIGRTSLGVRCVEGANWVVYVPVQVRLFVDAWVAARPIARGQHIGPDDVRLDRVDIAPLRGNAVLPDMTLVGQTALRPVGPGEPMRRDALRAPLVVQPGDAVQVVAVGTGFAAQSPGKVLTAAAEGQTTQVALPGGKVLAGVARTGGVVEVR